MPEKFIIYFGFPSTEAMLGNVESYSSNTDQSLEDAWIDLLHTFMRQFSPSDGGNTFISTVFSEVYGMEVIPPPYEQQKYPQNLGKTKFRLPAICFKDEYVICKATRGKIEITNQDLEYLCDRFKFWIDVRDVSYSWVT